MEHSELVGLIKDGVTGSGPRWAELGAGAGAFTAALADLLGRGGLIVAVDRDARALSELQRRLERFPAAVKVNAADFTKPIGLTDLDGVLMANSLHFVRNKRPVLDLVREMLRPGGRLVVVEYDTDRGNPWVPHPFSFGSWRRLAEEAGFVDTRLLATRPDRYHGGMYSALSHAPASDRPT